MAPAAPSEPRNCLWQEYYEECGYDPIERDSESTSQPQDSQQNTQRKEGVLCLSSSLKNEDRSDEHRVAVVYPRATSMPSKRDARCEVLSDCPPEESGKERGTPQVKSPRWKQIITLSHSTKQKDEASTSTLEPSPDTSLGNTFSSLSQDDASPSPPANCQKWRLLLHHALSKEDLADFSLPRMPSPKRLPLEGTLVAQSAPVLSLDQHELKALGCSTHLGPSRFRSHSLKSTEGTAVKAHERVKLKTRQQPTDVIPFSEPCLGTSRKESEKAVRRHNSKARDKGNSALRGRGHNRPSRKPAVTGSSKSLPREKDDVVLLSCLGVIPLGFSSMRGMSQKTSH